MCCLRVRNGIRCCLLFMIFDVLYGWFRWCISQEGHGSGEWTTDGGEMQAAAVVEVVAAGVLVRRAASGECNTAGR